jgi:hypothetical protein
MARAPATARAPAKFEPAGLKAPLQREPPDDAGLDAGCRREGTELRG